MDTPDFDLLVGQFDDHVPPTDKMAAAEILADVSLDKPQAIQLTRVVKTSGPILLPVLLRAYQPKRKVSDSQPLAGRRGDDEVGRRLVSALKSAPGTASLTAEDIKGSLSTFSAGVQRLGAALAEQLTTEPEAIVRRLAKLAPLLQGGDADAGKRVFFGTKAACAACHRAGDQGGGGDIGPDLTTIGRIRTHEDLLESILYPSRTLTSGFDHYSVITNDGRIHTGVIRYPSNDYFFFGTVALEVGDEIWLGGVVGSNRIARFPGR